MVIDLLKGNNIVAGADIRKEIESSLKTGNLNWIISGNSSGAEIESQTLSFLKSIWVDAQGDVDRFKGLLENWFDETMERTTGWYKKRMQLISFLIGLSIAFLFNVDTIKIANTLERDPDLRTQLVQQADAFLKEHPNLDQELKEKKQEAFKEIDSIDSSKATQDSLKNVKEKQLDSAYKVLKAKGDSLVLEATNMVQGDIKDVNETIGIGLGSYAWSECKDCNTIVCKSKDILISIFGWLITALALSLGAPFWFDLLNKLMKLRTSVAPANDPKSDAKNAQAPQINRKG